MALITTRGVGTTGNGGGIVSEGLTRGSVIARVIDALVGTSHRVMIAVVSCGVLAPLSGTPRVMLVGDTFMTVGTTTARVEVSSKSIDLPGE